MVTAFKRISSQCKDINSILIVVSALFVAGSTSIVSAKSYIDKKITGEIDKRFDVLYEVLYESGDNFRNGLKVVNDRRLKKDSLLESMK